MITLIGSTAAKHWFTDFRTPNDMDYHSSEPVLYLDSVADVFVDERLAQWDWGTVATPEELYTMKVSHSFWEITSPENWNKHMYDVVFFQRKGVKFNRDLYDILLPIWKDIHAPKITNLNQTSKKFFDDAVKRKYVHDTVHQSVAYHSEPLFRRILKPNSEVMVDKALFDALDFEQKLQLVREEVYVTALERILIPNDYTTSPGAAYMWALRRVITSLFKNDWALFVVLNYDRLSRPDVDYVKRHRDNQHMLILEDK